MFKLIRTLASNNRPDPLIVFVHTPKTGGTTINKMLTLRSYRGREHCQGALEAAFEDSARHGDWLSGHIPRDHFVAKLKALDRPIEYFSSVREPTSHLISHLNWYLEQLARGNSATNFPWAAALGEVDFSDADSIIASLLGGGRDFLNFQSYYVIGTDFATLSQDEIVKRLVDYTYISTEHNLSQLFRAFYFKQLPELFDTLHENVTQRHIDGSVFQSREMRDFIIRHHAHDVRLYNIIREFSWPIKARRRFRPARFQCQFATSDNFVEQGYLEANPDLVNALRLGQIISGRQHFELYGRSEARLIAPVRPSPGGLSHKIRSMFHGLVGCVEEP